MSHIIAPAPNNNGTSATDLIESSMETRSELLEIAQLMRLSLPHGRDYQTGGDLTADRAEAERRIAVVQDLAEAYYQDAIHLKNKETS